MRYLLLWLEAPLQSWGCESRFDQRETFSFPTLSGVFGILLASSGDSGAQCDLLDRMRNADFTAVEFLAPNTPSASQLCDYHMVGSGYDRNDKWEALHIPRKRDGSFAVGGGAKQTFRYYLQNKKFAVLLGLDADLAEKFSASLQTPVYDLYLGRKCCAPTDAIFRGLFDTSEEAHAAMRAIGDSKGLKPGKCFVPADPQALEETDAFFITDVPLEFGERKRYTDRCVQILESIPWENP